MIQTNFNEIENDSYPDGDFYVYVFRHGDDILYVGESIYAPSRVWEHFHKRRSNSHLSNVIDFIGRENIIVDLYEPNEIAAHCNKMNWAIVQSVEYDMPLSDCISMEAKDSRKDFESYLIYTLSPLCNASGKKSDPEKVMQVSNKYNNGGIANEGMFFRTFTKESKLNGT